MAEENEIDLVGETEEVKPNPLASKKSGRGNITLDVNDLQAMIANAVSAAVSKSSETSARIIAEALVESKKPYIDPRAAENDAAMREATRKLHERIEADIKASQEICPHMQGSNALSDFQGQLTSIVMHRLDTGLVVGICTNCQRQFFSDRPEDRKFFAQKSGNRMSAAGTRFFHDPAAAQKAGR